MPGRATRSARLAVFRSSSGAAAGLAPLVALAVAGGFVAGFCSAPDAAGRRMAGAAAGARERGRFDLIDSFKGAWGDRRGRLFRCGAGGELTLQDAVAAA